MDARPPSIVAGPPLEEEQGIGALTLGGWLSELAARHGAREALVFEEDGRTVRWSYDELLAQAQAVARSLVACGLGKGARVGVLMSNRPEFLAAVFGTALAGGVAATLSTFSTPSELRHMLALSGCSGLLLEQRLLKKNFAEMLLELDDSLRCQKPGALQSQIFPYLSVVAAVGGEGAGPIEAWDAFLARGSAIDPALVAARAAAVSPADPGVVFFSSGSTAKPKGILSAHRGVALQLWRWRWIAQTRDDVRFWSANGFFWSGNFAMALGAALSAGGSLVLQKTFAPEEALALMERHRVTYAFAWPHQYAELAAAPNFATADLSALHYVNPANPLGQHPSVRTDWGEPTSAYGNTETFTIASIFPANTPAEEIGGSNGRPLPGNVFKIVDPLSGEIVPMGERGEIAVKGPTLMLGYLGVPLAETLDDQGFLRTGDGGWFDEAGRIHWEGRLGDIIKTGGANVSPVEIDAVLVDCPGVKAVQTVGVPHDMLGEMVVSCIVPHDGAGLDEAGVQAFAKQALASYKVPRRVLFFASADLALTGSAKIKAGDLRTLAAKRLAEEA